MFSSAPRQNVPFRTSRVPVLMANGLPASPYRKVLITTDLSDASSTVAHAAMKLGFFAKADIVALHVLEYARCGPVIWAAMTIKEAEHQVAKLKAQALDKLDAFANKLGVVAERRAIGPSDQSTSMAINNFAKITKADLIVVGTRCRSGLERMLLGSVTERVLGNAEMDVLAIPCP